MGDRSVEFIVDFLNTTLYNVNIIIRVKFVARTKVIIWGKTICLIVKKKIQKQVIT